MAPTMNSQRSALVHIEQGANLISAICATVS
jgi:hypothetical protein